MLEYRKHQCIGEKWGPVLYIDNTVESVSSLTYARLLVRTKAQNKIDARIRLLFEHGSSDVWVKEGGSARKWVDRKAGYVDMSNVYDAGKKDYGLRAK